ncbi:hypothetical protein JX266_009002 [Neoarthrinium moseri]|nr:hypothetical protein JX266_009002 [Neoarthrinium moseri]
MDWCYDSPPVYFPSEPFPPQPEPQVEQPVAPGLGGMSAQVYFPSTPFPPLPEPEPEQPVVSGLGGVSAPLYFPSAPLPPLEPQPEPQPEPEQPEVPGGGSTPVYFPSTPFPPAPEPEQPVVSGSGGAYTPAYSPSVPFPPPAPQSRPELVVPIFSGFGGVSAPAPGPRTEPDVQTTLPGISGVSTPAAAPPSAPAFVFSDPPETPAPAAAPPSAPTFVISDPPKTPAPAPSVAPPSADPFRFNLAAHLEEEQARWRNVASRSKEGREFWKRKGYDEIAEFAEEPPEDPDYNREVAAARIVVDRHRRAVAALPALPAAVVVDGSQFKEELKETAPAAVLANRRIGTPKKPCPLSPELPSSDDEGFGGGLGATAQVGSIPTLHYHAVYTPTPPPRDHSQYRSRH